MVDKYLEESSKKKSEWTDKGRMDVHRGKQMDGKEVWMHVL